MMTLPILDQATASSLLYSEGTNPFDEERIHEWGSIVTIPDPYLVGTKLSHPFVKTKFSRPFLRRWDWFSGSQLDELNRMQARAPRERLHTHLNRTNALAGHSDYSNWDDNDTPFISFASSLAGLAGFGGKRKWVGRSTLTVVNPNVRIAMKLPMIHMESEMRHYKVQDPYNKHYAYYKGECLLLWEVTPAEIVGHWDWDELIENPNWYEEVIVPAFQEHDKQFFENTHSQDQDTFNLSSLQDALPAPNVNKDSKSDGDDNDERRSTSDDETSHSSDSGSDRDDDD